MEVERVKGLAFDLYGTVVDPAAVAEACREVAPDPGAFLRVWRAKQLEYTFLRSLLGEYRDFWQVTQEALEFAVRTFSLELDRRDRSRLMEAWLEPRPYPEVPAALSALGARFPLAILSNGSPGMLETGLEHTGLRRHFRWLISAHEAGRYKPSPEVYRLGPARMGLHRSEILFVTSNGFDVVGAGRFGFPVCWIDRTGQVLDPLGPEPGSTVESFSALADTLP